VVTAIVIEKVWMRLKNVLVLIIEGRGSNDLVETKRGKKFRNLDMPVGFLESTTETRTSVTENNSYGLDGEGEDSESEDGNNDDNNLT